MPHDTRPSAPPPASARAHLTVAEAAPILGLAPSYVRSLAASGELRAKKHGRSWLVREADVMRFVERPTPRGRVRKATAGPAQRDALHQVRLLSDMARAAADSDPDQPARLVVERCAAEVGADLAAIWWRNQESGPMHLLAASRLLPAGPWPLAGAAGAAIRRRRTVTVPDSSQSPLPLPWETQAGFLSTAAVPLIAGRRVTGALQAWSRSRGAFTSARVESMAGIAGLAAPLLEIRQAAEAAREEGRRFRDLFEQAAIGQAILSIEGRYVRVNRAYREMLGYTAAQMRDMSVFTTTHPQDMERNRRLLTALVEGSIPHYELEKRHLRPDGTVIEVAISASLSRDAEGRPRHVIGLMRDITARKQAERELEASRRRLQEVLNNAPVTLFATDASGTIVFAEGNGLAEAIGHQPAQVVGRSIFDLYPSLAAEPAVLETFADPEKARLGGRFQIALGAAHLECRFHPIWDDAGRLSGFTGIAADVTDRVLAEAARLESQQKSQFLATMSHELRTPLNSVLGFSQLLHSGSAGTLTPKQTRYVTNIMSSGAHLLRLINDVLDLSKVLAGRMQSDLEDLEVAAAVRDTLAKMQPLIDAKGQHVEVLGEPRLRVAADRRHLDQILLNLLSNAVKFTGPQGRLSVTASAQEAGGLTSIEVRDDGIGIAPEHLES
ncbi:MAG: PAS domain S-box protein, partial [Candidatus Dormibacterales bacterium]